MKIKYILFNILVFILLLMCLWHPARSCIVKNKCSTKKGTNMTITVFSHWLYPSFAYHKYNTCHYFSGLTLLGCVWLYTGFIRGKIRYFFYLQVMLRKARASGGSPIPFVGRHVYHPVSSFTTLFITRLPSVIHTKIHRSNIYKLLKE